MVALKEDGTVWMCRTGRDTTPVQVQGISNARTIAASSLLYSASKEDGSVWAWTRIRNIYSQTFVATQMAEFVDVVSVGVAGHSGQRIGGELSVSLHALRRDGTVWMQNANVPISSNILRASTADFWQVTGLGGVGFLNLEVTSTNQPYITASPQIHTLIPETPQTTRLHGFERTHNGTITINLDNGGRLLDLGTIGQLPPTRLPVNNVMLRITLPEGASFTSTNFSVRESGIAGISPDEATEIPNYHYRWLVTQNVGGRYETTITFPSIPARRLVELSFDIEFNFSEGDTRLGELEIGDIRYIITADDLPQQERTTTLLVNRQQSNLADLFSQSSFVYNHDLARLGARLSAVAYGRNANISSEPIRDRLIDMGFGNIVQSNYNRISRPLHHIVGYTLAHQEIEMNGVVRPVVFVVIRGTVGDDQWHSNFTIGRNGNVHGFEHYGFSQAEQSLHIGLHNYLTRLEGQGLYNAEDGIIFITGHSRGAAVANLLAYRLNMTGELVGRENLFAYTFATPNTTTRPVAFQNIFNFVNAEDFVAYLPLNVGWGFWKHGRTFAFPSRGLAVDGNGNDVFERHRDSVIREYRNLSGGGTPLFRRAGISPVLHIVSQFHGVAPTVYDFYNTQRWAGWISGSSYTPEYFMNIVADAASGNNVARLRLIALAGASPSSYATIANFFINETWLNADALLSRFDNPHDERLYRAWLYAINEEDLIEHLVIDYRTLWSTRTIRIACPVDVRIYDSNNQLVGRVVDNIIDETIDYENIFIYVDGDVTYVYKPSFATYTVRIIATDYGTMTFAVQDIDIFTLGTLEHIEFEDVALYPGREMISQITDATQTELLLIENNQIIGSFATDGTETIFETPRPLQVAPLLRFTIGQTQYTHNSLRLTSEVAPFITDGRTMIPLRIIAEALGADVSWNGATQTVAITQAGRTPLHLVINIPLPDGMGTPVIENGRTLVPARYVSEMLGATVRWDGDNQAVYIYR